MEESGTFDQWELELNFNFTNNNKNKNSNAKSGHCYSHMQSRTSNIQKYFCFPVCYNLFDGEK